jgi:hypothetical protein
VNGFGSAAWVLFQALQRQMSPRSPNRAAFDLSPTSRSADDGDAKSIQFILDFFNHFTILMCFSLRQRVRMLSARESFHDQIHIHHCSGCTDRRVPALFPLLASMADEILDV